MEHVIVGEDLLKLGGAIAYLLIEYWLGRTDKVKSGSTLEMVLRGLKYLFGKKKDPNALG